MKAAVSHTWVPFQRYLDTLVTFLHPARSQPSGVIERNQYDREKKPSVPIPVATSSI